MHRNPQGVAPASCGFAAALVSLSVLLFPACASTPARPLEASGPAPAAARPAVTPADPGQPFEQAATGPEAAPVAPGLPIGARAPSFVLQDQHGREVTLESLVEGGPVALVFLRSAGW